MKLAVAGLAFILGTSVFTPRETAPSPRCFGHVANRVGTSKGDVILGTFGDDVIRARKGDDTVFGLSGNDLICGGKGDDTIDGMSGEDRANGGKGHDSCFAERTKKCE